MLKGKITKINKRNFLKKALRSAFLGGLLLKPSILRSQMAVELGENGEPRHNIFSFRSQTWKDHFDDIKRGAILVDIETRCLHFWLASKDFYKIYPTSVPLTEELTRRGTTKVVQKIVGPEWRPTESMKKRDPQLPDYMPAGPDNPLGTHALYLGWPSYRIHGTSDTRKIGRQSSSGCIGLYNEHIKELFDFVDIGTQVKLI